MLAKLNHGSREPSIRNVVGSQILFDAELAQQWPFSAERRHFNARHGNERIQEPRGLIHGRGVFEYL